MRQIRINTGQIRKAIVCLLLAGQTVLQLHAQDPADTLPPPLHKAIHKLSLDIRPSYLTPTNSLFKGENGNRETMNKFLSGHLKYGIQFHPDSRWGRLYPHTTQGIGLSVNTLFNASLIGTPVALYTFQSSRIASLAPNLSLDYEWNFGASFGWKKFDEILNPDNDVVGSRINAYLNLGFFLNWQPAAEWNLSVGVEGSHFSNGNSHYPNSGVNTIGARIGITRNFGDERTLAKARTAAPAPALPFRPHVSWDVIVYGATKIRGWNDEHSSTLVPGSFGVAGINVTPLYNFHRMLRAGISIDAQYDESANIRFHQAGTDSNGNLKFFRPSFSEQFNAGLSARCEFVMPVFSISLGIGYHFLHKGEDTKGCYQVLALKTSLTRNLFLHTGYQLQNFHDPNHLMLGLGWRFNDRR